ncbi:MAG: hypothetical protein O3B95_11125 [Chloroflexi bacterium]|nr:hypothetical protein [Chloroflexota bacterium]
MTPKYLMRILREPLPGKAFELMDAVIEQRKQMGIADGMTTVSVASARMLIVSSTPYENLADLQARVDGIFDNQDARKAWDRVGALARSTVNNLSRIVEPPEGIEEANYIQRYVFEPRITSRRQLVDALREINARSGEPNLGITASINGSTVIASRAVRSMADMEEPWDKLRDDPGTLSRAAAALALCDSWSSGIAKVVSRP